MAGCDIAWPTDITWCDSNRHSTTCWFLACHAGHALSQMVAPGPCSVSFFCHQWLLYHHADSSLIWHEQGPCQCACCHAHGHECGCHACCQVIYLVCPGQCAPYESLRPCACCYYEDLGHAVRCVWKTPFRQCVACFCLAPVEEICVFVEEKGTACFCDYLACHASHVVVVSLPFLYLF